MTHTIKYGVALLMAGLAVGVFTNRDEWDLNYVVTYPGQKLSQAQAKVAKPLVKRQRDNSALVQAQLSPLARAIDSGQPLRLQLPGREPLDFSFRDFPLLADGYRTTIGQADRLDAELRVFEGRAIGDDGRVHTATLALANRSVAGVVRLANGGRIESAAFGPGKAGELDIAADTIDIDGEGEWFDPKDVDAEPSGRMARSGFVTSTVAKGDAGTIHLSTPDLNLDGGIIGSASDGEGKAGSINLGIGETMVLQNDGQVSVRSALADGGDITVQTGGQVLVDNSELSASAKLDGGSVRLYGDGAFLMIDGRITAEAGQDGGNIFVEAPETFVLQRSRLSANAIYGHGGYILIVAEGFLPSIETAVTASSEFGVQGTVEIRTPDSDVGSGLVILPSTIVTEEINLAERCTVQLQSRDKSSFVRWGYGGVPSLADQLYLPTARFRFSALSGSDEDEE